MEKLKEDLFVKKGRFGWYVVYPIKKDPDKPYTKDNINWKNLFVGSWSSFLQMLFLFLAVGFLLFAYVHDTKECYELLENPCETYDKVCGTEDVYNWSLPNLNVGDINGRLDLATKQQIQEITS